MSEVIFEKRDHIAYVTINRPEKMNAMNAAVRSGLNEAWTRIGDEMDIWCAIITGAGDKAFSAGADLQEMSEMRHAIDSGDSAMATWERRRFLWRTQEVWKPIIAAVNGYCLAGGLELAMACDFIVASEEATFGLAEVTRAIIPGGGGTQRLPRLIPFRRALELLLTGDRIGAEDAYQLGLVNKVLPASEVMKGAEELAEKINSNGPLAVRAIKELAYKGMDMPLEQGLRLETLVGDRIRMTEDAKEGPLAFVEKRKPEYKGR
ncbi:MAG: enoyl-CoA hydratase/isomerase family protein [Dehalococcoidia bacterium]